MTDHPTYILHKNDNPAAYTPRREFMKRLAVYLPAASAGLSGDDYRALACFVTSSDDISVVQKSCARPVARILPCNRAVGGTELEIVTNIDHQCHTIIWEAQPSISTEGHTVSEIADAVFHALDSFVWWFDNDGKLLR
ncbi:MAG: hypothetical protein QNJ97_17755 [Myxococcota bacterium]|nr:hypothetical protein [Myxococcota bacterium]